MRFAGILKNTIQEYAWGSRTAITELLGTPPPDKPQAELWMGAHPKASSQIQVDGRWESLADVIAAHPKDILGAAVSERFGGRLPYLFKVLAAAKPLSIQAHPNVRQAAEGFARENRQGIPLTSAQRNFRDDSHKPECLCALTQFWGLCGFRFIPEITGYLNRLCPDASASGAKLLEHFPDASGIRRFMEFLLTLPSERKTVLLSQALFAARRLSDDADPVYRWILRLHDAYPSDVGILSPAFLNLVRLEPKEAMFLAAGEPHAYLEGVGIELMANSDNVLRGGLTPKHVDVPQLLDVLTFKPCAAPRLSPRQVSETEWVYDTPAPEFRLSLIRVSKSSPHVAPCRHSADILLCTDGGMTVSDEKEHDVLTLEKGASALLPAVMGAYRLHGDGVCYRASTPV